MSGFSEHIIWLGGEIFALLRERRLPPEFLKKYTSFSLMKRNPPVSTSINLTFDEKMRIYSREVIEIEKKGNCLLVKSVDLFAHFNGSTWEGLLSGEGGLENLLRIACAFCAPFKNGVLLHACGAVRNGKAYMFPGPSGSGKSTIAHFLNGEGWEILGDDLIVFYLKNKKPLIASTPFGDYKKPLAFFPLNSIFFPIKWKKVMLRKCSEIEMLARLISSSPFLTFYPDSLERAMDVFKKVKKKIPPFFLYFKKDPSFIKWLDNQSSLT